MSLLDKYQQNSPINSLFGNNNTSNSNNNDLLSKYSSSSSLSGNFMQSSNSSSVFGNIKSHFNFFGVRGINQDNFSIIDRMRGIQGGKIDIDGEISLTETYLDKSIDTKVMGGMYNQTTLDMYQDEKLFNAVYGLYTDGIVKEKENYMVEQDSFSKIEDNNSNNSNDFNSGSTEFNNLNGNLTKTLSAHNVNNTIGTEVIGGVVGIGNVITGTYNYNKSMSGSLNNLNNNKFDKSSDSTIHNNIYDKKTLQNDKINYKKNSSSTASITSFLAQATASAGVMSSVNTFMNSSMSTSYKKDKKNKKINRFCSQKYVKNTKRNIKNANFASVATNIQSLDNDKPFVVEKTKNISIQNSYNKCMSKFLDFESEKLDKAQLIDKKRKLQEKLQTLDEKANELEYNMILKQIDKIDEELFRFLF